MGCFRVIFEVDEICDRVLALSAPQDVTNVLKTRSGLKGDSHWALYGQPLGLATITVGLRPPGN